MVGLGITGPEAFAKELGFILRAETGREGKQGSGVSRFLVILAAVRRVDWAGASLEAGSLVRKLSQRSREETAVVRAGERHSRGDRKTEQRVPVLYFLGVFNL